MLIKVGSGTTVNATEVDSIYVREEKRQKLVKAGNWLTFTAPVYKEEQVYVIELNYTDNANKQRQFNLSCVDYEYKDVLKLRDDILSQVKELEIEKLSAQLENAIRNS